MADERIAELERLLEEERNASKSLALDNQSLKMEVTRKNEEIKRLKTASVNLQARVEEEEEFLTNSLLRKLEKLQKEKEQILMQVEAEEEFMTNNLQKKLDTIRREKVDLENHLEAEQEAIVNRLQKQLVMITRQKNELERKLQQDRSGLIEHLESAVTEVGESLSDGSRQGGRQASLAALQQQLKRMSDLTTKNEREADQYRENCSKLAQAVEDEHRQNLILESKIQRMREFVDEINYHRYEELFCGEVLGEREFNHRRLQSSGRQTSLQDVTSKPDTSMALDRKSPISGASSPSPSPMPVSSSDTDGEAGYRGPGRSKQMKQARRSLSLQHRSGADSLGKPVGIREHTLQLLQMSPVISPMQVSAVSPSPSGAPPGDVPRRGPSSNVPGSHPGPFLSFSRSTSSSASELKRDGSLGPSSSFDGSFREGGAGSSSRSSSTVTTPRPESSGLFSSICPSTSGSFSSTDTRRGSIGGSRHAHSPSAEADSRRMLGTANKSASRHSLTVSPTSVDRLRGSLVTPVSAPKNS